MTDNDITKLIAEKVMGWEFWIERRGEYEYLVVVKDGREPWKSHRHGYWESESKRYRKYENEPLRNFVRPYEETFSPLTTDRHAFEVVDKMVEDGFTFSLISGGYASKSWNATFYGVDEYSEQLAYEAIHESRCKAICIAALKAVGVEV